MKVNLVSSVGVGKCWREVCRREGLIGVCLARVCLIVCGVSSRCVNVVCGVMFLILLCGWVGVK